MTNSKGTDLPASFILGLLIGGVLVAFFTPKKGENLRQDVSKHIQEAKNRKHATNNKISEEPIIDDSTPLL